MEINTDYKIKVSLTQKTYTTLINDMYVFDYIIKDNINKSGFINLIFKNYHEIYDKRNQDFMIGFDASISNPLIKRLKTLNISQKDLVEIEKFVNINYKEFINKTIRKSHDKLDKVITFKINKENQEEFNDVYYNVLSKDETLSSYFRNLIEAYTNIPQYIRETIIFNKTYNKLIVAIKRKRKTRIKINDNAYLISPYKVLTTIEENNNFLIGSDDYGNIKSYRLCKIKEAIITNDEYVTDEYITEKIDHLTNNGTLYSFSGDETIKVKLTNAGVKTFYRFFTNRPRAISIDNNIFEFKCSREQIFAYFIPFGENATIIEPKTLKESFIDFHKKALSNYKKSLLDK